MCSIETSPTINAIGSALLAFQKATHGVVKDSRNPHFKNRYASLEAVIEAAKPGLQENGLAFLQAPGRVVNGALEVSTMLLHPKSGEWIRSTMSTPLQKQDPQGVGSAITYCCRYALMASLGLPALDDDAEATRHQPEQKRAPEAAIAAPKGSQHITSQSREVYVENSLERIAAFDSAADLLAWARTERAKVWPQYGIDAHDSDGQQVIDVFKARMALLESQSEAA